MWPLKHKRKPGRPPSWTYRAVAIRKHKHACVVPGCGERRLRLLDVHHKDENPWNNRPGNLEFRCRKHHLEVHGRTFRYGTPEIVQRGHVLYVNVGTPVTGEAAIRRGCCLGTLSYGMFWLMLCGGVLLPIAAL